MEGPVLVEGRFSQPLTDAVIPSLNLRRGGTRILTGACCNVAMLQWTGEADIL